MNKDYKKLFLLICQVAENQAEKASDAAHETKSESEEKLALQMRDDYVAIGNKIDEDIALTKDDVVKLYIATNLAKGVLQNNIDKWTAVVNGYVDISGKLLESLKSTDEDFLKNFS